MKSKIFLTTLLVALSWSVFDAATFAQQPNNAADNTAASFKPENPFVANLKRAQADLRAARDARKPSPESAGASAVEAAWIANYQVEIEKAQKLIDAGVTYGLEEFKTALETVVSQSTKSSEQIMQSSNAKFDQQMRSMNEDFSRTRAESDQKFDAVISESSEVRRKATESLRLADMFRRNVNNLSLVIWNLPPKSALHDRATTRINTTLTRGSEVVWEKRAIRVKLDGKPTIERLPNVMFDKVEIEVTTWNGDGGGLAEVAVMLGNENVALARPCVVSNIETLPIHLDDQNAVTDSITHPTELGVGYWIPEAKTKGSVTIDLLGPQDANVLKAVKEAMEKAAKQAVRP